jgi:hypothetical protein
MRQRENELMNTIQSLKNDNLRVMENTQDLKNMVLEIKDKPVMS